MTRMTNSRLAGFAFLFYIAVGITSMIVFGKAIAGENVAARLTTMAQSAAAIHLNAILALLEAFSALVLAVTLYAITREQDPDIAMLGMACRIVEGVLGAGAVQSGLSLLWLATAPQAQAPNPAAAQGIAAFLLWGQDTSTLSAIFFSVGSLLFSWLFLRGRIVPAPLAWLGLVASAVLVVALPMQLAGIAVTGFIWLPAALFEASVALWLLIKGAAPPARVLSAV